MLSGRVMGIRRQAAGSKGGRTRALAGVVTALGLVAAAFAVLSTLAATRPKPQAHVVAGVFTIPSPSPATPAPAVPLRRRPSQLAIKTMGSGEFRPGDTCERHHWMRQ